MFEELLKEMQHVEQDEHILTAKHRQKISPEKFVKVTPKTVPEISFIDGGNGTVYASPGAQVEFVRIAQSTYHEKKDLVKQEGFLLIRALPGEGKITVKGYGTPFELEIADKDPELSSGAERVTLAKVAELSRFLLECRMAATTGIVVRDGTLEGTNAHERAALKELLSKRVIGVAKTTALLTTSGRSLQECLSKEGRWCYLLEENEYTVGAVQLHPESKHIFRVDTTLSLQEAAAILAVHAGDAIFPGYPYPLIDIDQHARVSNREIELLKQRFMVEAGKGWQALEQAARAADAHTILDSMSF